MNDTVFAVQDNSISPSVKGDADDDGFAAADTVMLQKRLLNADGIIDVFDLALIKRAMLSR